MAYQNYFPVSYQPYANPYQTQFQPPQAPQMSQQIQQAQPTQGAFIRVQSENEARMYPVAPGNSVVFIDEIEPYCYTKTVDRSQLDRPKFEKYRLVKEEGNPSLDPVPLIQYAAKADLEPIWNEINAIKDKMEHSVKKVQAKKKEEDDD